MKMDIDAMLMEPMLEGHKIGTHHRQSDARPDQGDIKRQKQEAEHQDGPEIILPGAIMPGKGPVKDHDPTDKRNRANEHHPDPPQNGDIITTIAPGII